MEVIADYVWWIVGIASAFSVLGSSLMAYEAVKVYSAKKKRAEEAHPEQPGKPLSESPRLAGLMSAGESLGAEEGYPEPATGNYRRVADDTA